MKDLWKKIASAHVEINSSQSTVNADAKYIKVLNAKRNEQELDSFYQAIDALERGCGYGKLTNIEELYKAASQQDSIHFLRIVERAKRRIDIVLFIRSIEHHVILDWIEKDLIQDADVLFEVLRQCILQGLYNEQYSILATGMRRLIDMDSGYFKQLLENHIGYRLEFTPTMGALLKNLPLKGWRTLSEIISFHEETKCSSFWIMCCKDLDWKRISAEALPVAEAWIDYITACLKDRKYGATLYNDVSIVIIGVLSNEWSEEQYLECLEAVLNQAEKALYRWFRDEVDGLRVLMATLSFMEHMRQIWIIWEENRNPQIQFPFKVIEKISSMIQHWQYAWSSQMIRVNVQEEICQLEEWLKHKANNTAFGIPDTIPSHEE